MRSQKYSKRLCMSELQVEVAEHAYHHFFDASAGKINSSFGYVEKGSVVLHSLRNTITVPEGSLFYVPNGVRYQSVWTGSPEIKQYCIHIIQKKYDLSPDAYHPLQLVKELSTPETGALFKQIYQLFSTEDRIQQLKGLSLYYQFYSQVLPLLKEETPVQYSSGVRAAVHYIEEMYREDFTIEELAEACFVSSSTLYHQFKKELQVSPIQFRNEIRIEKAAAELRNTDLPISEIAQRNGFNSSTYFFEVFKKFSGLTPSEYRRMIHM